MANSTPRITDAEWEVMNLVWRDPPVAAKEIADELAERTGWSVRTVKTLVARLVKKRALAFEVVGQRYLYRPLVSRDACVRAESRSFLRRVAGGSASPLLAHFVREATLTPDEIAELRRLLEEKEAGR